MDWFLDGMLFMAGYAASVYTWSWLRTNIHGVQSEIAVLEARVASLRASLGITPAVSNLAPAPPVAPVVPMAKPTPVPPVKPTSGL